VELPGITPGSVKQQLMPLQACSVWGFLSY
jgi:hypothetical protein